MTKPVDEFYELAIKSCPFCGSEAAFEFRDYNEEKDIGDDGTGWVRCHNYECGIYVFGDFDSAIEKWNRRVND